MQRYFLEQPLSIDQTFTLPDSIQKHWLKVLRAAGGQQAEFVAADHRVYIGELMDENAATVKVVAGLDTNAEMPVRVTIACGVAKNDKAEWLVQKATEMGVFEVVFFAGDWSIAKWPANRVAKKLARLNKIAHSAAEQSHRNLVPVIKYQPKLAEIVKQPFDQRIVAYEESAKQGEEAMLNQAVQKTPLNGSLLAIFGPEGGVSLAEITMLEQSGVQKAGLGPRILRTETAPLALLAAVSTLTELS